MSELGESSGAKSRSADYQPWVRGKQSLDLDVLSGRVKHTSDYRNSSVSVVNIRSKDTEEKAYIGKECTIMNS